MNCWSPQGCEYGCIEFEDGSSTCSSPGAKFGENQKKKQPLSTKNSDAIRGCAICQKYRFYGQAAPSTVAIFFLRHLLSQRCNDQVAVFFSKICRDVEVLRLWCVGASFRSVRAGPFEVQLLKQRNILHVNRCQHLTQFTLSDGRKWRKNLCQFGQLLLNSESRGKNRHQTQIRPST